MANRNLLIREYDEAAGLLDELKPAIEQASTAREWQQAYGVIGQTGSFAPRPHSISWGFLPRHVARALCASVIVWRGQNSPRRTSSVRPIKRLG
jgi:hypothetical protein